MKIDILTLFPEMFEGPFGTSMLKKAQDEKLVEINIHNLRNWAKDKHKTVDGRPYGGGPGMIIRADVVDRAVEDLKLATKIPQKVRDAQVAKSKRDDKADIKSLSTLSKSKQATRVILLSAKGKKYTQQKAQKLATIEHLILICGHYEGVDERVAKHLADEEISIGNYILTGGEIPAIVMVDSIVRLIPGVLGNPDSLSEESHSPLEIENYTEYPQYTRPEKYKGWKVPKVLLSGNHAEIEKWRSKKTFENIKNKPNLPK